MAAHGRIVVHHFERLANFRDIGGLQTADGRMVRTGVLFRSGRLSRMTAADVGRLRAFGIKLICDLRAPPTDLPRRLDGALRERARLVHIPLHEQMSERESRTRLLGCLFGKSGEARFNALLRRYYDHMAFEQGPRIRELISLLAQDANLPALIHCAAGRDRTGFMAAVIQLLLGVPYAAVVQDYLLSNDYFAPVLDRIVLRFRLLTLFQVPRERLLLLLTANADILNDVHTRIMTQHGSIEQYLTAACRIDPATLERLRSRLLA